MTNDTTTHTGEKPSIGDKIKHAIGLDKNKDSSHSSSDAHHDAHHHHTQKTIDPTSHAAQDADHIPSVAYGTGSGSGTGPRAGEPGSGHLAREVQERGVEDVIHHGSSQTAAYPAGTTSAVHTGTHSHGHGHGAVESLDSGVAGDRAQVPGGAVSGQGVGTEPWSQYNDRTHILPGQEHHHHTAPHLEAGAHGISGATGTTTTTTTGTTGLTSGTGASHLSHSTGETSGLSSHLSSNLQEAERRQEVRANDGVHLTGDTGNKPSTGDKIINAVTGEHSGRTANTNQGSYK